MRCGKNLTGMNCIAHYFFFTVITENNSCNSNALGKEIHHNNVITNKYLLKYEYIVV